MGAYDTLGPTDWDNLAGRLCLPGLFGSVCLADDAGNVYLLKSGLDKQMRLEIDLWRNGRMSVEWFSCARSPDGISGEVRALFLVGSRARWPKLARNKKKRSARELASLRDVGVDPDERIYQARIWRDPAKCIAHLRRNLPGLHEITGDVHNEVALRLRDAESA